MLWCRIAVLALLAFGAVARAETAQDTSTSERTLEQLRRVLGKARAIYWLPLQGMGPCERWTVRRKGDETAHFLLVRSAVTYELTPVRARGGTPALDVCSIHRTRNGEQSLCDDEWEILSVGDRSIEHGAGHWYLDKKACEKQRAVRRSRRSP